VTVITGRVPVAEISRQARDIRFGRSVLALVTGVLFAAGWALAKLFAVAWLTAAWSTTAVRVGWQHAQAHAKPSRSAITQENADLLSEVERLRAEVQRLNGG